MIQSLSQLLQERVQFLMNLENATQFHLYQNPNPDRPIMVNFMENPREMDSRVVCWKGASIFARLESSRDCWVSRREWDRYGLDLVYQRALFLS